MNRSFISKRLFSIIFLLTLLYSKSYSQFTVDTSKSVKSILNSFLAIKGGVKVDKIHYTGNKYSIGLFRNHCSDFPLEKGIILSTGDVWDAVGPNNRSNSGNYHYFKGDPDLEILANGKTFDAASLEFDFAANSDSISFDFIFASEEYPEFVNKGLNDIFAFFISDSSHKTKHNIALCNNKPITVNNINSSNNSKSFISNSKFVTGSRDCLSYSLQFDGLTKKLSTGLKLTPYQVYHFKICISDVGDGYFDSAVMLRGNSFASVGKIEIPKIADIIKSMIKNDVSYFNSDSGRITFIPNITYDFDSFEIPDTSIVILNNLVNVVKQYYDFKIDIIGYSDNIGSSEYNTKLSLSRAQSVSDYFVKHDIEKGRINTIGLGCTNPIAENNIDSGRAKNRRVTIKLYKP